jgi:hypothetical protein
MNWFARESTWCTIQGTFLVDHYKMQTNHLGKSFLVPNCMQPLVSEVHNAFMVGAYHEFSKL